MKKLTDVVKELKMTVASGKSVDDPNFGGKEGGGPNGGPSGWASSSYVTEGTRPLRTRVRKWPPAAVLKWLERKGFYGSVLGK